MNDKYKNFTAWAKSQCGSDYPKIDWSLVCCYVASMIICLALIAAVLL